MKALFFLSSLILTITITAQKYKWTSLDENENYVARHECSFVQSGNHFVMFGGREQAKRLDIYDYATNTWSQGTKAPIEFNHFQATQYQGLIWVVGAFQTNNYPNEVPASHIYMYHPVHNTWIQGPEIPEDRRRGGAGLVMYNDKFYLVAGNTKGHNGGFIPWLDEYDPINNTWKRLPDAPHARDHFSAVLYDHKIYAVSGRLSGGQGGTFKPLVPEVDIFDLKTNTWETLPKKLNIPTPRAGAAVCVFDKQVFVMGGEGEQKGPSFKTVEALQLDKYKWKKKKDMNHSRHGTQAIVSGKGIFVAAGSPVQAGGRQKNMEVYGENNPQGEILKESDLVVPKSISFESNKTQKITIKNKGGNTANFIESITIEGEGYELDQPVLKQLLKIDGALSFSVTQLKEGTSAILKIIYNDKKEKQVIL